MTNKRHHLFPNLKRENGCWYIQLGGQWIPCGTWERVLIVYGGH